MVLFPSKESILALSGAGLEEKIAEKEKVIQEYFAEPMREIGRDPYSLISLNKPTFIEVVDSICDEFRSKLNYVEANNVFNEFKELSRKEGINYFNEEVHKALQSVLKKVTAFIPDETDRELYLAGIDSVWKKNAEESKQFSAESNRLRLEGFLDKAVYSKLPKDLLLINESEKASSAFLELASAVRTYSKDMTTADINNMKFPSERNVYATLYNFLHRKEGNGKFEDIKNLAENYANRFPDEISQYRVVKIASEPIAPAEIIQDKLLPAESATLDDALVEKQIQELLIKKGIEENTKTFSEAMKLLKDMSDCKLSQMPAAFPGTCYEQLIQVPSRATLKILNELEIVHDLNKTYKMSTETAFKLRLNQSG